MRVLSIAGAIGVWIDALAGGQFYPDPGDWWIVKCLGVVIFLEFSTLLYGILTRSWLPGIF